MSILEERLEAIQELPLVSNAVHRVSGMKKKDQHDGNQAAMGVNPTYAGAPHLSQIPYMGARVPEVPALPHLVPSEPVA